MVDFTNFAVLTFREKFPDFDALRAAGAFCAESCARQVWVGPAEIFTDELVPSELRARKSTEIRHGKDAYEYFLRFYCGLEETGKVFSTCSSGKVRGLWKKFLDETPNHKLMKSYIDPLFEDGLNIKSKILDPHVRFASIVRMAAKAAELRSHDHALIIAGAETITVDTLKVVVENKNRRPHHITIAHPDSAALGLIRHQIMQLPNYKNIKDSLRFVSVKQALDEQIFKASAVFVCQPMAAETEDARSPLAALNRDTCDSWGLRRLYNPKREGQMFHLKGTPELRGQTSGVWKELDEPYFHFTSYEELRLLHDTQRDFNRATVKLVDQLIKDVAAHRLDGDRVVKLTFDADPIRPHIDYKLAKRPLGRFFDAILDAFTGAGTEAPQVG